jgi:hypothetical protein
VLPANLFMSICCLRVLRSHGFGLCSPLPGLCFVLIADGSAGSFSSQSITVLAAALPAIDSISPETIPVNAQSTRLTVRGSGFHPIVSLFRSLFPCVACFGHVRLFALTADRATQGCAHSCCAFWLILSHRRTPL